MSADAHQEIVGLDVPVYERLAVDVLYTADHLISEHQYGFYRETARAKVEQVLQRRTQQIHNQHVVFLLLAIISEMYRFVWKWHFIILMKMQSIINCYK